MVLFGQSAGAAAVDIHAYAWAEDPIVRGYIAQSGTVALPLALAQEGYDSWGNLTLQVGCAGAGPGTVTEAAKMDCMRAKPWEELIAGQVALRSTCGSGGSEANFYPRIDGKVLFTAMEYAARQTLGLFARLPLLVGVTDREIGVNVSLTNSGCAPDVPPAGMTPEEVAERASNGAFNCPARDAAAVRYVRSRRFDSLLIRICK